MRWILHFRVCIIICLAVVLITAAVLFSVLRATLPYATSYKNEIQLELSQQIGLPVEIQSIDAAIHWFSPRLRLLGVSVFDEKNKVPLFNFEEAFVELDVIGSIVHQDIIVDDIGLIGAELSIEKLSEKEWLIQGIKFTSEGSSELPEKFLYMIQNSDYLLHDSDIYYQDHTGEKLNLRLVNVNINVKNNFNNHDIKFSMNLPEAYGEYIAVVANLNGDITSLDGDIYVEASKLKLRQWNQKFQLIKTHQLDAIADVNIWASLDENNFEELETRFSLSNVLIKNNSTNSSWSTNYLSSDIRYMRDEGDDWSVAVKDFHFGEQFQAIWGRKINALASADENNYYISADFLRIKQLREIANVLFTKQQLSKLRDFDKYQLSSDIYNLNIKLPREVTEENIWEELYLDASVLDITFNDKANGISAAGVDASLHYDDFRLSVEIDTEDAELMLENLFREKIVADVIEGELVLEKTDLDWRLLTENLQIQNSQINTFSRFNIIFNHDESTFVDIQTNFYDGRAKYAKHYLPVGIMSEGLVDWLDMSIIDGTVNEGQFILHGNLSDFPYDSNNGVFQVLFNAEAASIRFLEEWPLITDTSAKIKFNNSSLVVNQAGASTQNGILSNGYAEINNLIDPHLTVKLDAHSKLDDMQSYVWNSPLDDVLGDALKLFQFEGESHLSLQLDVPLNEDDADVVIDGHLAFINSSMYYPALAYDFRKINGIVAFTKDSVFADGMSGFIDGNKVEVSIFTQQGKSGRENVFHLDGVFDIDYLLQRYDWLPEHWLLGESKWSLDLHVPYKPKDYLVHISARSDLKGIAAGVSDLVNKSAAEALNLTSSIDVLDDNGLHVSGKVNYAATKDKPAKEIIDLYAIRNAGDIWSFDIKSEYMTGKGQFTEGLARDTNVKLDFENIDLQALSVTKNSRKSEAFLPSKLPPLTWTTKQMLWGDLVLTDVYLNTNWHQQGMLINKLSLKGPAMTFDATGTWLTSWRGGHETVLQGSITSSNFGDMLTGLGFQRSIDRSEYTGSFDTRWSAEPYAWSWANMKGKTSFAMKNGEILDVNPGTGGRLLGLLNIFKLANRLAFDFDDVTRDGFVFDYIKGDFEFVNGDGSLKDVNVSAPAADINMFGSIGLIERDYGLLMRVKPHTDSLTFAGGALLGGVVVGAGLALIQKVFDLSVVGHNVYSVTGSWDDPQVEKIIEQRDEVVEDDDDY